MASTISRWHEQIAIQTIIVCALEWWHAWKLYSQLLAWVLPLHPRTRINGAKKACEAKKDTHIRCALQYDIFLGWRSCHRFLMDQYQLLPLYSTTLAGRTNTMRSKSSMLISARKGRGKKRRSSRRSKGAGKNLRTATAYAIKCHTLIPSFTHADDYRTSNIKFIHKVCFYLPIDWSSPQTCFYPSMLLDRIPRSPPWKQMLSKDLIAWKIAWLLTALHPLGDLGTNPRRQVQKVFAIKYEIVWYMYSYWSWMIIWTHPNP